MKTQKYFVTMTDKFMSNWGMSDNRVNKLVIECDTMEEANTVYNNACQRHEMKYVNIVYKKPYYPTYRYFTNYHDKTDYSGWFSPHPDWH
jgi:hypothetical protein